MCQILLVTKKKLSAKERRLQMIQIRQQNGFAHPVFHFASEDDKNHQKTITRFEKDHPKGIVMYPKD